MRAREKRKEKKEEERRVLAELDAEIAEKKKAKEEEGEKPLLGRCPRCKTNLRTEGCPTCGYKIYVGMSEEERKKIKNILTVVGLAIFLVLFIVLKMK